MKHILTLPLFLIAISQAVFSQSEFQTGKDFVSPGTAGNQISVHDGSGSLGFTYSDSACGLNYVQASQLTETRSAATGANVNGTGLPTTLAISGIPSVYSIEKAYLWYLASYQSGIAPSTTVTITNPNSQTFTVVSSIIGTDLSVCWGETGTASYRADVTSTISGNGNYIVDLNGFTNKDWEVDGVTLFIVYKDLAASYQGTVVIWDGIMAGVGNQFTQTMTNLNVCATDSSASGFILVGDMQDNVNGGQHPSTINGNTANYFNDFWNFDKAPTSVTLGQTSSVFGTDGLGSDCFGWIMMGLYYQTNCASCCTSLTASAMSSGMNCGDSTGSATANASCGTPPYSYLWSDGQTTQTATGFPAGNYTVIITDSLSAADTATVSVTPYSPFAATTSVNPVTCFGGNDGSATIYVSGGTAPYTYLWNPTGQTSQTATGLSTGTYSVIVNDSSGCVDTFSVAVPGSPMLLLTLNSTPSSCYTCPDGGVFANVFGGTPPHTYLWSSGQTTLNITGLMPGNYTLCVTDGNNCTTCDSVSVLFLGVNEFSASVSVSVFPNPFSKSAVLQITNEKRITNYELKIFDIYGKETGAEIISNSDRFVIRRGNLQSGMYFYKLISKDGKCAAGKLLVE